MKNILTEALVNSATNASFIFSYTNSAKLRVLYRQNTGGNVGIVSEMQKKTENLFSVLGMAGVLGFEPRKCQIQSLMPYRLAIPQCAYL